MSGSHLNEEGLGKLAFTILLARCFAICYQFDVRKLFVVINAHSTFLH